MFRYLAMAWDAADRDQTQTARLLARQLQATSSQMQLAFDTGNLMVFYAGSSPGSNRVYHLSNDSGVVLGRLFGREVDEDAAPAPVTLDDDATSGIIMTGGYYLIERYWGRYVAFLQDKVTSRTWVLRDPTGVMPCFLATYGNVRLIFSSIEDCAALAVISFSVDWDVVAAFLADPSMQTRNTALDQVSELLPGERLEIRGGADPTFTSCWDPVRIATSAAIESMNAAVAAARRTIRASVTAWASCHPRIIHRLSGGLDSSIVLACLRRSPTRPTITCLNYFDSSREGDERVYARLVAADARCELIEHMSDPRSVRLEAIMGIRRSARPSCWMSYVLHTPVEERLADGNHASAVFGGGGGDNLFYVGAMHHAAVDYVHRHLFGRDLFRIAVEVAHMSGHSIWGVLYTAILEGLFRQQVTRRRGAGTSCDLVNPAIFAALTRNERFARQTRVDKRRLAPGKLSQALATTLPYALYSPLGRDDGPEHIEPLVSQPLMELFLQIPTYLLMGGGEDRAVARRAFANDVRPEIISRNSKGEIGEFLMQVLRCNEKFVRELLLDGLLVKERLLNRRNLAQFFSTEYSALTPGALNVIDDYISLEVWLRGWPKLGRPMIA